MFGFGKKDKSNEKAQNWFGKLKSGLSKSSFKINEGLKDIFVRKKIDEEFLEELEDLLITSDMGIKTASIITQDLAKKKFNKEIDESEIKSILSKQIEDILTPFAKELEIKKPENGPYVILFCGVNGSGKTTTIGKYASFYKNTGFKVMLAACDSFRAAATEQLEIWAQRVDCPIIKGKEQSDPASIAYKAYESALEQDIDVLLIDTAGRLQNKTNLMQELNKINNVIKKQSDLAPHEKIIILDGAIGQNSVNQVEIFNEFINLTGMIITKLDGTAKGGVVVNLANNFKLPIYAIGVGESIEDLKPFKAKDFANSLIN